MRANISPIDWSSSLVWGKKSSCCLKHLVFLSIKIEAKAYFDHNKGMFGVLAVLKCVTADLAFASVELLEKVRLFFSMLKVRLLFHKDTTIDFFLSNIDTHLHLWSISYRKIDLYRESMFHVKPEYVGKKGLCPSAITILLCSESNT